MVESPAPTLQTVLRLALSPRESAKSLVPRPTVSVLGVAAAVLVFDVVVGAGATWWRISDGLSELGASGAFSYVLFVVTAAKRLGKVLARLIGCGVALPLLARRSDRTDRGELIATSMTYGALALSVPFVCVPALVTVPIFAAEVASRATSARAWMDDRVGMDLRADRCERDRQRAG